MKNSQFYTLECYESLCKTICFSRIVPRMEAHGIELTVVISSLRGKSAGNRKQYNVGETYIK